MKNDYISVYTLIVLLFVPWPFTLFLGKDPSHDSRVAVEEDGFLFSFENSVQSWLNYGRARFFGVASSHIVVGRDQWLFYRGNDVFEDLLGFRKLDESEIRDWYQVFEDKQSYVESCGADYLLVTVPNKSSIEKDRLPYILGGLARETRYDQLIAYDQHRLFDSVLHLREAVLEVKSEFGSAFWFDDTHWNGIAFGHCLNLLFGRLQSWEPLLDYSGFLSSTEIEEVDYAGDLANLANISKLWPRRDKLVMKYRAPDSSVVATTVLSEDPAFKDLEPDILRPIVIERAGGYGSALIFHDSFLATAHRSDRTVDHFPFSYPFRRTIHIWKRPNLDELKYILEVEKVDFVVEMRVERLLYEGNNL